MTTFTRRSSAYLLAFGLALVVAGALARATDQPATQGIVRMQNTATTGNGVALGTGTMSRCRESAIYIVWNSLTTGGGVQVETAHDIAFTGTWAPLGSPVAWSAASKEDVVQITGIHGAVRARISTTITGVAGTAIDVWGICN